MCSHLSECRLLTYGGPPHITHQSDLHFVENSASAFYTDSKGGPIFI
jgi:hypothetical protein